MNKSIACLGVLLIGSQAMAAIYAPTKDTTFIKNNAAVNGASTTYSRLTKGGDPYFDMVGWTVIDFDRAAILAQINADIGHTLTLADLTAPNGVKLKLNVMPNGDVIDGNTGLFAFATPAVFQSASNWSETNANFYYADSVALTPWKDQDGNDLSTATNFGARRVNQVKDWDTEGIVRNAALTQWGPANTFTTFTLEGDVAWDFLSGLTPSSPSTPKGVAGLQLLSINGAFQDSNTGGYSRENATVGNRPFLEVSVPEPAILGMVGMSSLLVLRRRRA